MGQRHARNGSAEASFTAFIIWWPNTLDKFQETIQYCSKVPCFGRGERKAHEVLLSAPPSAPAVVPVALVLDRRLRGPAAHTPSTPTPTHAGQRLVPAPARVNITSRHPSDNNGNNQVPEDQPLLVAMSTVGICRNFQATRRQERQKRWHIDGEAGKGQPWAITARPGRARTTAALRVGLATIRVAKWWAAEERMQRRSLVAVIVVAAGVAFLVAKARLIGGGPGRERMVVIHAGAAVAKLEGAGKGVSQTSFRPTHSQTGRSNSRSAKCAGGDSPRRRWRSIPVPARRCSRLSERWG